LKRIIIFKAAHALQDIEAEIMIDLYIKAIELIEEDREVFVQPVSQISSPLKQSLRLPGFIKTCKFVQCH